MKCFVNKQFFPQNARLTALTREQGESSGVKKTAAKPRRGGKIGNLLEFLSQDKVSANGAGFDPKTSKFQSGHSGKKGSKHLIQCTGCFFLTGLPL